jgi:hypothetical protein
MTSVDSGTYSKQECEILMATLKQMYEIIENDSDDEDDDDTEADIENANNTDDFFIEVTVDEESTDLGENFIDVLPSDVCKAALVVMGQQLQGFTESTDAFHIEPYDLFGRLLTARFKVKRDAGTGEYKVNNVDVSPLVGDLRAGKLSVQECIVLITVIKHLLDEIYAED